MLGLLLLYFIGKSFFTLAKHHEKPKWLFSIVGVFSYIIGAFIGILVIAFISPTFYLNMSYMAENFISLPFGIGICIMTYYILKNNWKKQTKIQTTNEEDLVRLTEIIE